MLNKPISKKFTLVQISDCHLFADRDGLHHQANVYQNFKKVLLAIKAQPSIDAIVFTGDLTQDHSEASYELFVQTFEECEISTPVYYVAGNHDDYSSLQRYLSQAPFCQDKVIENEHWQVMLLESKSATPAGMFNLAEGEVLAKSMAAHKAQLILMHHHAIDVGYFIDDHGLNNQEEFQCFLAQHPSIAAVACGHIHQALSLTIKLPSKSLSLYSCPATSIQFDANADIAKSNGQPPGYRLFTLAENKQLTTQVFYV